MKHELTKREIDLINLGFALVHQRIKTGDPAWNDMGVMESELFLITLKLFGLDESVIKEAQAKVEAERFIAKIALQAKNGEL